MHGSGSDNDGDRAWVFGYGSLIYKVDFPVLERSAATLNGWKRRFWQASHDHRGTPDAPGRVVTLVPEPGAACRGMAYRVDRDVFDHLDHREKNGYGRHRVRLALDTGYEIDSLLYVAESDNPAWLGPAPVAAMADQIAGARGPSGRNADYLLHLADALRDLDDHDPHVFELEAAVRKMLA